MTQTQLMTMFLDGIPPGTVICSGLMRAAHNRLWWQPAGAKIGRSLALRNETSMLLAYGNHVKKARSIAPSREDWMTRECERRGIPFAKYETNQLLASTKPLAAILNGMGITTNTEFDPCSFHLLMGAVLNSAVFHYDKPTPWLIDRWGNFYTTACSLCNLEPLFPDAKGLHDWYIRSSQLL
jgi:hypothetical protein